MTLELAALVAAAFLLTWAVLVGRQTWLLMAVLAYTIAVSWIIQRDMILVLPALGIAIVLGVLGLVLALRDDVATPDVTTCHNKCEVNTNDTQPAENIGQ